MAARWHRWAVLSVHTGNIYYFSSSSSCLVYSSSINVRKWKSDYNISDMLDNTLQKCGGTCTVEYLLYLLQFEHFINIENLKTRLKKLVYAHSLNNFNKLLDIWQFRMKQMVYEQMDYICPRPCSSVDYFSSIYQELGKHFKEQNDSSYVISDP